MHCPNCGENYNENQNFCSNCGANLGDKANLFVQHKKKVKKEFLAKCKDVIGEHDGCCKIGQAAWFIATNTKGLSDYLQGEKMGLEKSYELLNRAVKEAEKIAQYLAIYANAYRNGDPIGLLNGQITGVFVVNQKFKGGLTIWIPTTGNQLLTIDSKK